MHEMVGSVHVKHIYEIAKVLFLVLGWFDWIERRVVCLCVCVWMDRSVWIACDAMPHPTQHTHHHPNHPNQNQQVKQKDYHLSHLPLRSLCRMVFGTCGTMGLKVDGLKEPAPVGE